MGSKRPKWWIVIIISLALGGNPPGWAEVETPGKSSKGIDAVDNTDKSQHTFDSEYSLMRVADDKRARLLAGSKPLYQPPRRGAPGGRVGGGTRGPSTDLPFLYALVPDHVALSTQDQPHFVWYLSKATSFPLEFTILEGVGVQPLLEVPLSVPEEPGIQILSLSNFELTLQPGKTYQWFVSLIPDRTRRSRDILAGGMLELAELPDGIAEEVKDAPPLDAAAAYAQSGFWYDAIGVISVELQKTPTDRSLRDARAALLEQVDLATVARVDRRRGL